MGFINVTITYCHNTFTLVNTIHKAIYIMQVFVSLQYSVHNIATSNVGKTMIARILGKLLHMAGILPTDKVTEVQRTDLAVTTLTCTTLCLMWELRDYKLQPFFWVVLSMILAVFFLFFYRGT